MAYKKYKKEEVSKEVFNMEFPPDSLQIDIKDMGRHICNPENELLPPELWKYAQDDPITCMVVQASAGTGKTTTVFYFVNDITQTQRISEGVFSILITSFSNSTVEDAAKYAWQFPGCDVNGMHKIGKQPVFKKFGKHIVKGNKTDLILKSDFDINPWDLVGEAKTEAFAKVKLMKSMIKFCKVTLTDWKDPDAVDIMMLKYGLYDDANGQYDWMMDNLCKVMEKSLSMTNIIDFEDMLFMPIHYNLELPKYDLVIVDEAQDINAAQQELVSRMSDKFIFVGDKRQAIYGFAGADAESFQNIIKRFNGVELPLNKNYRCGKAIIRLAQSIVGEDVIVAWEESPEGSVTSLMADEYLDEVKPGDFVICRKNAPLVAPCFALLKRGVRCSIKGKDISEQLIELFKKVCKKSRTINDCFLDIEKYKEREEERIIRRFKDNAQQQIEALENKADTLTEFVAQSETVEEVIPNIEKIFDQSYDGKAKADEVAMGSCHWSKGKENKRVFVLEWDDFDTMFKNSTPMDVEQRTNLKYISVTRAMRELFLVNKNVD